MSSMSPHWQVAISVTSIYGSIVAAVTTIAVSLIIFRKLWKSQNKSRDKGISIPLQTPPTTSKLPSINQDARDEVSNPDIATPAQASISTSRPRGDIGSEEVPSTVILSQGSQNFQISETNATVIRNADGQFSKIQRNLVHDHIMNLITLPNINYGLKKHDLTQSIITLPRAEAVFYDYRNKKKCVPCFTEGTTMALLREMADCITGSSKSRMYILFGLAGIGKSTVAYTIASRAADLNLLGASFCFSREDADRNNAKRFFTTIAYQLCVYNETFAKAIGDVLKTERGSTATTKDPQDQLQALILDPLRSIVQTRSRSILIVVDALDECDEKGAFSVFTGLSQLVCDLPSFKVILTTRPQPFLDAFLSRTKGHNNIFHLQDIEDTVVEGDIRLYLNHCLSLDQVQMRFPKWQWCASNEEIDSLVRTAGGLFIIASTAVRYILDKTASNPAAQMQKLLRAFAQCQAPFKDLDQFYTVILRNIVPENCDDDNLVSRYQSVVGTIIFIQRSLPVSTLAHLIGIDVEKIRVMLDRLQSVLLFGDDDVPWIYHKSFSEYVTDQARCKDPHLRIDPRIRHTQIVTHCFEIMNKHLKYNILGLGDPARFMSNKDGLEEDRITAEQLEEKIPQQLRYACIYWVNHLKASNTEDADLMNGLEKFLAKHLLHWFEVLSLVGKLDSAHLGIVVVLKLLKLSSNLHRLLSDAVRFIGKFYEIIKRSALHTYYSALSFTPTGSLLYRRYHKDAVHNICVIEGGPESWDAIVADLRHGEEVDVVKFSLDSTLLVSCSNENIPYRKLRKQGKLKIWDAVTGTPISTIPCDKFAVANNCSTVASSQDNIAMLYYANGSRSGTSFATSSKIEKLALSSECSRVAAALSDGTVWLWESRNAELIASLNGFDSNVYLFYSPQLKISPTGTRLTYSSVNGIVKLRDGISGRFIADLRCGSWHQFEFSSNGSRIASLSKDCGLTLWDSESGGLVGAVMDVGDIKVGEVGVVHRKLAISANGSLLATADYYKVTLWSENRGSLAQIKVLEPGPNLSMGFSLDDILAITIALSSDIKLYNVKTHSFIHPLLLRKFSLRHEPLAISPDCTRLAVGHDDDVILCDIRGIASDPPPKGNATDVAVLTLSRDCSRLACGFWDGTVELWGTSPTKRRIASHQAYTDWVHALVFGPDGGLFASVSYASGPIKLWNGKDGLLYGTLQGPHGGHEVAGVALSNSVLVLAARRGNVIVWSLNTLSVIHTYTGLGIYGQETPIVSIAENNALIAIADTNSVSLLDAENHRTVTTFRDLDGIHTMTFLPNNLQLVVQSKDGVLLSFNLINKRIMKGAILEHLIQLPNIPLWHGVPVWYCRDKEQHYLAALFPQNKSPVPVLWIPKDVRVTAWTQGSSMIAFHCEDGRIILLRLPTSHVG